MFDPFVISGIGAHTGAPARVTVEPGEPDTGIVFVVDGVSIPARPEYLVQTAKRRTVLRRDDVSINTVEHFLAAATALRVTDLRATISGPELPILDGSAGPWLSAFPKALRRRGLGLRPFLAREERPLELRVGDAVAAVVPVPRESDACIDVTLDLSAIGRPPMHHCFYPASDPMASIASARTFAFAHEVEALRAAGLAAGGSLENAVVLDRDGVLNPEGLRFVNEPARHKVLDAVGDLFLLGALPRARIRLIRPGHRLNLEIVRRLSALLG